MPPRVRMPVRMPAAVRVAAVGLREQPGSPRSLWAGLRSGPLLAAPLSRPAARQVAKAAGGDARRTDGRRRWSDVTLRAHGNWRGRNRLLGDGSRRSSRSTRRRPRRFGDGCHERWFPRPLIGRSSRRRRRDWSRRSHDRRRHVHRLPQSLRDGRRLWRWTWARRRSQDDSRLVWHHALPGDEPRGEVTGRHTNRQQQGHRNDRSPRYRSGPSPVRRRQRPCILNGGPRCGWGGSPVQQQVRVIREDGPRPR